MIVPRSPRRATLVRVARVPIALVLLFGLHGAAHAQAGCYRLSWGTCDPWARLSCFQGPGKYRLVLSGSGITSPNIGTDFNLHITFPCSQSIPDAWRFDDPGCQTGSRLSLSSDALDSSCPVLRGPVLQEITNYSLNSDGYGFKSADL